MTNAAYKKTSKQNGPARNGVPHSLPGLNAFCERIKIFARKKPWHFAFLAMVSVLFVTWALSAVEILPEFHGAGWPKSTVIEQGDTLSWLGMRVAPISRSIRKEFKIPRKVRGMFVLDEGKDLAQAYGVKTGDVIVSIGRKPVPNASAFVKVANNTYYYQGIFLDIYRDGKSMYITVPFQYQYGPMAGPNKGSWQLGAPLLGKPFSYGPIFK